MTDALRLNRTAVGYAGPAATAAVGAMLIAVGIAGLTTNHGSTTAPRVAVSQPASTPAPVTATPHVIISPDALAYPSSGTYVLAGSNGRVYAPADAGLDRATHAGRIVGGATAANGGVWLVNRDGVVTGLHVGVRGSMPLKRGAARVVGIAPAAFGRGYRIVTADGHTFTVGAPKRGGLGRTRLAAPVVGIAAAAKDGYWIALANGHVYGFGAPDRGGAALARSAAPVVGIASSLDGRGYWLATADGHVYAFGVPANGDPARTHFSARVVGIAAAPNDGFWLVTADGRVYPFGAPQLGKNVNLPAHGAVTAIIPN